MGEQLKGRGRTVATHNRVAHYLVCYLCQLFAENERYGLVPIGLTYTGMALVFCALTGNRFCQTRRQYDAANAVEGLNAPVSFCIFGSASMEK